MNLFHFTFFHFYWNTVPYNSYIIVTVHRYLICLIKIVSFYLKGIQTHHPVFPPRCGSQSAHGADGPPQWHFLNFPFSLQFLGLGLWGFGLSASSPWGWMIYLWPSCLYVLGLPHWYIARVFVCFMWPCSTVCMHCGLAGCCIMMGTVGVVCSSICHVCNYTTQSWAGSGCVGWGFACKGVWGVYALFWLLGLGWMGWFPGFPGS